MSATKSFVPRALKMSQGAILSTPLPSAPVATTSLPEAQFRAKAFFREICREMPWIMKTYNLSEVTTIVNIRSQLAEKFREVQTQEYKVVDLLIFKAQAELTNILGHHFQRHHLITKYVDQNYAVNVLQKGPRKSAFLNAFYKGEI